MSLLSLQHVTKRFDGITAVDDVSFDVDRGQVVGFLGPNGAGKSTTMRMITQFFEPDAGEIQLDGVPMAAAGREAKRRIGFLPENNPLYGEMLVAEYLDFVALLRELAGAEKARAIGELSKGFKQRVGLAAAILHRPDLLVLDEPTEGLDPNQRVEIRRLIGDLGRERTVMLSTHVLPEVQHTCSRLLIINRGHVVADGGVAELVNRAGGGSRISVEVVGKDVERLLAAIPGVHRVDREDATDGRVRVSVMTMGGRDLRGDVFDLAKASGWRLLELHQEAGSLEDLFRELTTTDAAKGAE